MKKQESDFKEFLFYFQQNRAAVFGFFLVLFFIFLALFAPFLAPYDPHSIQDGFYRIPPFWQEGGMKDFILGTDDVGRDLLSRLIYGSRVSIGIGLLVVFFSLTIGSALGLLAGYLGGWVDVFIMRLVDILMAIPGILLAIVVVAILGPSLMNAIIAVSVVACPSFIRLMRASVMKEKNKQYVIASRSLGCGGFRQAVVNILPNCLAPIIIQGALGFSEGVLSAAGLGFLGMGAQPPTPEWGTMLSDARAYISSAPWLVTLPGLCIFLIVLAFNLFGDGLRDAFDPRLKR